MLLFLLLIAGLTEAAPSPQKAFCPFHAKAAKVFFAPEALEHGAIEDFAELFGRQSELYGPCRSMKEAGGGRYELEYRDADMPIELRFDEQGRILDVELGRVRYKNDSFVKVGEFLAKRWTGASVFAAKNGEELFAVDADRPLNVYRSGQLFLLKALRAKTGGQRGALAEIVSLKEADKTPFFSHLDNWADGTQITLDSLKNLVFIENDFTASDLLLRAVGRDLVEKQGKHLAPFLSFKEYGRILAFPESVTKGKSRKELRDLAATVKTGRNDDRPDLLDRAGWFASTRELCAAALALKDEKVLYAGMASASGKEWIGDGWENVASLQARLPSLVQSTWLFTKDRDAVCLALSWNGKAGSEDTPASDLTSRIYELILKKVDAKAGR